MSKSILVAVVISIVSVSRIFAQPHHSSSEITHDFSITIAPIKLISPIVEGTFEKRMTNKIGLEGIAGVGSYDGFFAFTIGGSWRYYLIGSFEHALQTGVELYYAHLGSSNVQGSNVSAAGRGLMIAPFIGYKYIADYGLTLDLAIGAGPEFVSATATDNNSNSATVSGSTLGLLLNLNLGWSF